MLKNLLTITFRVFTRNKLFSLINILGLSISLTAFILIMLWVRYELSYDRFHKNSDQIYRLIAYTDQGGKPFRAAVTPAPSGKYLLERIPEIINYTTFRPSTSNMLVKVINEDSLLSERSFYEQNRIYADSNFFDLFDFPFVAGSPDLLLNDPYSLAISESMAKKYFKDENPVGRSLFLFNRANFIITSVFKDIPDNSHIKFDFVIPWEILESRSNTSWGHFYFNNYLLIDKNADIDEVTEMINEAMEEVLEESLSISFYLQPLHDIHLKSNMDIDLANTESEIDNDVYYFSVIAMFILLIACINFVNLTTARATGRAKEVGLRKVVGASRRQLLQQFMGETVFYTILSFIISIALIYLLLPVFNEFTGKDLDLFMHEWKSNLLWLAGLILATGLIAGIYPSVYLSSFQSANILKGNYTLMGGAANIRKLLFIIQIGISVMLIIASMVVSEQLNLVKSKDLGYDKENLIYFNNRGDILNDHQGLKAALLSDPAITSFTTSSDIPTTTIHLWGGLSWEGMEAGEDKLMYFYTTDFDFKNTLGIRMKEGRWFEMASDSVNYVINESAANHMGLENPVGKWFQHDEARGKIIGVIEDFHFKSLREKVEPLVIRAGEYFSYSIIKYKPGMESRAIEKLRTTWKEINPEYPFEYHSLTEELNNLYKEEKQKETLYSTFTILAIFISCLGLFGLAAFTIEKRHREIAIRKVMGATASTLVINLSSNFIKLGIIANIITWPITWYLMTNWLDNFTYRVDFNFLLYGYGLIATVIIIMLTIAYHISKAMHTNPADALKYE